MRTVSFVFALILANVGLTVAAFFYYAPLRNLPHAYTDLWLSIVMLMLYAAVLAWFGRTRSREQANPMAVATIRWAVVFATWEILHIAIENFAHLSGRMESRVTAVFIITLFFLFGLCAAVQANSMQSRPTGIVMTIIAAMIGMLVVTTFGLSQIFWSFRALAAHDAGDPDFYRSGWTDFHAFVIADILQACFKLWLIGPIAACLFGAIGSLAKKPFR